tara:strand:+ start:2248 stop:2649 length:402 start_codon:yes stop_codon:yes gene_type:complete
MKMKQCSSCPYVGPIYKNVTVDGDRLKLCKSCAMKYNSENSTIEKKPPTRIKPVSDKRAKQKAAYLLARNIFLMEHAYKYCPVTGKPATEIHHTNGRENERLLDRKYWLAVSREGHQWIHNFPEEAREKGWLI